MEYSKNIQDVEAIFESDPKFKHVDSLTQLSIAKSLEYMTREHTLEERVAEKVEDIKASRKSGRAWEVFAHEHKDEYHCTCEECNAGRQVRRDERARLKMEEDAHYLPWKESK